MARELAMEPLGYLLHWIEAIWDNTTVQCSFVGLWFRPFCKDLFDWEHNPSHSTLYPNVSKIKTIIVANLLITYKVTNPISGHPLPRCPNRGVARNGFINTSNKLHFQKKNFTTIII